MKGSWMLMWTKYRVGNTIVSFYSGGASIVLDCIWIKLVLQPRTVNKSFQYTKTPLHLPWIVFEKYDFHINQKNKLTKTIDIHFIKVEKL